MSKKILSLILAFALLLSMVTGVAFAAEDNIPFKVYLPDNHGSNWYGENITSTVTKTTVKLDCIDVTTGEPIGKQTCYKVILPAELCDEGCCPTDGAVIEIPGYVAQEYGSGAPMHYPATTVDGDYGVDDNIISGNPTFVSLDPDWDGQNDVIYVKQPTGNYVIKFVIYGTEDNYGEDFTEDEGGELIIPEGAPFTDVKADVEGAIEIAEPVNIAFGYYEDVPYYHVIVPAGTSEVAVTYPADTDMYSYEGIAYGYTVGMENGEYSFGYYNPSGPNIVINDDDSITVTFTVEDFILENGTGTGVSLEDNSYNPINVFTFEYASAEGGEGEGGETEPENNWHFEKITIDGTEIAAENIEYKGIYSMGDLETDDRDYYSYIHEVPLYVVTVPCGTEYVDVTYSADTNILDSGSDAYGYITEDVQIDAMSSATVKGTTFKNGYTKNADGTQTVKTPVKEYTLEKAKAITVEEDGGSYDAVCLFTFVYDGEHVYTSEVTKPTCTEDGYTTYTCTCGDSYTDNVVKTDGHNFVDGECTVCFEPDPDYVPGGELVIPDGAPFTDVKADVDGAVEIKDMGTLNYNGTDAPYYKLTVPAGTTKVSVTHPSSVDPFYDASYDAAYGYYTNIAEGTGGYVTFKGDPAEDGAVVEYPMSYTAMDYNTFEEVTADFTNGYAVGVEAATDFAPIVFFSFEYAAGTGGEVEDPCANGHTWGVGVVTTAPTCTKEGEMTYTCTVCEKETKTEPIKTLDHEYSAETDKCSCGALDPAHEHEYGEYTETKAPTCTEEGTETGKCKCGATDVKSITKLGHKFVDDEKFCTNGCGTVNDEYVDVSAPDMENGAYIIETAAHLIWFANEVNTVDNTLSAVLAADIDLTGETWTAIGTSSKRFAGTFDGANHKITLNSTAGLFGYVKGASNSNRAEIKNVIVEGTINATTAVGGITGYTQYANITNCVNRANITTTKNYASGITLGLDYNTLQETAVNVTNCLNEGNITGAQYVAGIVSCSRGNINVVGCANTGDISGTVTVGGIAGYLQGYKGNCTVESCYNLGKISGGTSGGLVGNMYNSAHIKNSYNAGEAAYGYAGTVYNKTATITNSYYLVTKSTMGVPSGKEFNNAMVSKTLAEMTSEEFVTLLGEENFKQSCPTPVLSWQEAKEHNIVDGVCSKCGLGAKQTFNVTLPTSEGFTVTGEATAAEGEDYTFTVTITEGYWKTEAFKVYVNGNLILSDTDTYIFEDVAGPLSITVSGVEKIPDNHTITLPATGNGYAVNGAKSVVRGSDYNFTVTFANGFKAGENFEVTANGKKLTANEDGSYTIAKVLADQVIAVSGTEMIPYEDTANVRFSITLGKDKFYKDASNRVFADVEVEVPYFDLSLYGLEKYYYNPYCYVDENGVERERFVGGNTETAYGNITAIHAFICFTEIYYLNYDAEDVGKGLSYANGEFADALSWSGSAGSSFMNFWDWGTNLNYYVDYVYPLGQIERAMGSTSDQIRVDDGTLISMHFIEGGANGSNYMYFASNDTDGKFDVETDGLDRKTVEKGEKVTLTLFKSRQAGQYSTAHDVLANKQLLWTTDDNFDSNVNTWNSTAIDGSASFVTDTYGRVTIDTSKLAPGTYYISALGGMTDPEVLDDGFKSNGFEYGPALFTLVVEGEPEPEIVLGDIDGNGEVSVKDALAIYRIFQGTVSATEVQKKAADVNGDGEITVKDAIAAYKIYQGL